jgi:hypothetical protein
LVCADCGDTGLAVARSKSNPAMTA